MPDADDDEPMQDAVHGGHRKPSAIIIRDRNKSIPLCQFLSREDLILLLTPIVVPPSSQSNKAIDPFEPLGRALSERYPIVRHVPYTKDGGINGFHVAFIKKAELVLFFVTGISVGDEPSQLELAHLVEEACDSRPLIVVFCCEVDDTLLEQVDFPVVIQTSGFEAADLETVSLLLLADNTVPASNFSQLPVLLRAAENWHVEAWNYERDISSVHALWEASLPSQFHLEQSTLGPMLQREGYALHHVVRDPKTQMILGFCAAYFTFADSTEDLIGSVAVIIVREDCRRRGIGRTLHDEVLSRLEKLKGVTRLQIGSTFPRLLHGMPLGHTDIEWFQKQGWNLDQTGPGAGHVLVDWTMRFSELPSLNLASAGLSFRACRFEDSLKVRDLVAKIADKKNAFGWYDQYARTMDDDVLTENILLGFEGATMVAAAITYTPNDGSPAATDNPWPASLEGNSGGVTCICINDDDPEVVNRRDTIMVRLLHACCKSLANRGMDAVFLDGLRSNETGLETLGFRQWAQYLEVWRYVQAR